MWESSSKASWMCVIKTGTSTKNSRNLSKTNGKKNESQIEPLKGKDTEISWQRKKHSYNTIVIITIVSFKNIKNAPVSHHYSTIAIEETLCATKKEKKERKKKLREKQAKLIKNILMDKTSLIEGYWNVYIN